MQTNIVAFSPSKLRHLRRAQNLNRTDLAHRAGTTVDTVATWEQGRATPRANKLPELAMALGVDPADLFEAVPDPVDEAIARLVAAAPALTAEQRDRLAGLLRPAVHLS